MNQVTEFIYRRFPKDENNWLNGNCYYFAIILKTRFPQAIILYDVIDGHFVASIDGIKYDWWGEVEDYGNHYYVIWDEFDKYDSFQKQRIIRDCVM